MNTGIVTFANSANRGMTWTGAISGPAPFTRAIFANESPRCKRLKPTYILEQTGQTMHFFSNEYLFDLLAERRDVNLEAVAIPDRETG